MAADKELQALRRKQQRRTQANARKSAKRDAARAVVRQGKRDNATVKSNLRRGVKTNDGWGAIGPRKGGPERKAAADKLRADRAGYRKVVKKDQARLKSNARHGLGFAPKGSHNRLEVAARLKAKRRASSTKRTFATVELARNLKARGYQVRIKRGKGMSLVNGTKTTASGRSINVHAQGTGRRMTKGAWGGTVINRNTRTASGMRVGYQRLVGNPAKPKGPGIRTAKQRAASIANLKKARSSRMRKGKR